MYWRLSSFYLFYYASLGVLTPYWALYLKQREFSDWHIGLLLALPHLTKLGAPNLWGWLADRRGRRRAIIQLGALAATLIFGLVFLVDSLWGYAAVLIGYSFFWNAVMAQCEVVTLQSLGRDSDRYAWVRLWGSLGFMLAVLLVGALLEVQPVAIVPVAMWTMLAALALSTLLLPDPQVPSRERQAKPSILPWLRRRDVQLFLLCAFLMQASHGPYYSFFTIHLREQEVAGRWVGALWALGVLAEILLFLLVPWLLRRWSAAALLSLSLGLAVVRWSLTALVGDQLLWLLLAQCLHAATFGCFHAAAMAWVHQRFPAAVAGQGQALYASLGSGAGWAGGALLAGVIWQPLGAASFLVAAAMALMALLLSSGLWQTRRENTDGHL